MSSKKIGALLWVLQVFQALFIALASGAPKLLLPAEALPMPIPLSQPFMWFIGVCEVLGGLGLVLPGLLRYKTGVTTLAAVCLVLLTLCATVYQLMAGQPESAVFALVMAAIFAFIAYGRRSLAPLREGPRSVRTAPALATA
jgi:hypothetical protein